MLSDFVRLFARFFAVLALGTLGFLTGCGATGSNGGGGGGGGQSPAAPGGLSATAGNAQVGLSWNASSGATGYHAKRGTASGGPYTQVGAPSTTSYSDTGLTDGTTYYYVVSAVNANGESANSSEVSATPASSGNSISVTVDVLTNRHPISPYVYGAAYPQNASTVTDLGLSVVRWGGNATSTYNWQLKTNNAAADWYFEDFNTGGFNDSSDGDSIQFVKDVKSAGGNPLMTMVMLPWVAKQDEHSAPGNWSFSVVKYGAQCKVDPYNPDAGNGQKPDCSTPIAVANPNDAYVPLLDDTSQSCPSSATGACVYRKDWATALATAFGSAPHFYDMDNEIDIWGGTHVDIHPAASAYSELRDTYLTEARNLKVWDPNAIRLGPVSCCWWFYWNGANGNDKTGHAGIDFLPWWLNEVYWQDQVDDTKSLDVFDIHAYPDADIGSLSTAQKQALAASIYRDYWDPSFLSPSQSINQTYATQIEPNKTHPFRLPRMRAIANTIYPGIPLSVTEWSAAFAGDSDFSTALGDADALGILGRERVYLASRWTAPSASNPNYLAFKLYTNYDGAHHGFAPISVSDTNNGDPDLFSSFAAVSNDGKTMTIMVINKDPQNAAQAQFSFANNEFRPGTFVSYTLAASSPTKIAASTSASWSPNMSFAPYSVTLLVISGSTAHQPSDEWDLNPDTIMVPAGGAIALQPRITSGTSNFTLTASTNDPGVTVALSQTSMTPAQAGAVTVTAGATPGFYRFSVTGTDGSVSQTQAGWIVVGNPAATLAKAGGDHQSGTKGSTLPTPLTVTLSAGQSGGTASGACILFSTTAGTLATAPDSNSTCTNASNANSGSKVIAVTNASGAASVTLTLPSTAATVTVTAEGPFGLGHPTLGSAPFTETSQ